MTELSDKVYIVRQVKGSQMTGDEDDPYQEPAPAAFTPDPIKDTDGLSCTYVNREAGQDIGTMLSGIWAKINRNHNRPEKLAAFQLKHLNELAASNPAYQSIKAVETPTLDNPNHISIQGLDEFRGEDEAIFDLICEMVNQQGHFVAIRDICQRG